MGRRIRTQADVDREEAKFTQKIVYAAVAIAKDISTRRGIGDEWDDSHPEQQTEIVNSWCNLIREHLS